MNSSYEIELTGPPGVCGYSDEYLLLPTKFLRRHHSCSGRFELVHREGHYAASKIDYDIEMARSWRKHNIVVDTPDIFCYMSNDTGDIRVCFNS